MSLPKWFVLMVALVAPPCFSACEVKVSSEGVPDEIVSGALAWWNVRLPEDVRFVKGKGMVSVGVDDASSSGCARTMSIDGSPMILVSMDNPACFASRFSPRIYLEHELAHAMGVVGHSGTGDSLMASSPSFEMLKSGVPKVSDGIVAEVVSGMLSFCKKR